MSESRDKTIISSVEKAMNLIKVFTKEDSELTLTEISKKLNYNTTTTMRYINTLEKLNILEKKTIGQTPYYQLGMELFVIGSQALHTIDLPERAQPYLKEMAQKSGENAYLFIERNHSAYCVAKQTGDNLIQAVTTNFGDSLSLNVGGGPSAILVSMNRDNKDEVLEELNLNDKEQMLLEDKFENYQMYGYTMSKDETYKGTVAIGAPIFNHEGATIGSLSLGGIADRFSKDRIGDLINILLTSTNDLSKELGWHDEGG